MMRQPTVQLAADAPRVVALGESGDELTLERIREIRREVLQIAAQGRWPVEKVEKDLEILRRAEAQAIAERSERDPAWGRRFAAEQAARLFRATHSDSPAVRNSDNNTTKGGVTMNEVPKPNASWKDSRLMVEEVQAARKALAEVAEQKRWKRNVWEWLDQVLAEVEKRAAAARARVDPDWARRVVQEEANRIWESVFGKPTLGSNGPGA